MTRSHELAQQLLPTVLSRRLRFQLAGTPWPSVCPASGLAAVGNGCPPCRPHASGPWVGQRGSFRAGQRGAADRAAGRARSKLDSHHAQPTALSPAHPLRCTATWLRVEATLCLSKTHSKRCASNVGVLFYHVNRYTLLISNADFGHTIFRKF